MSIALNCTVQFALHWMSVYIALNCNVYIALVPRAFSSDPPSPPSGQDPSPSPYCWIHIALFLFTSIRNNGPFLFKVPERQQRLAILIQHCSSVVSQAFQGWRKIIFHFLEISAIVEEEKSLQVTGLYGSLTR